MEAFQLEKEKVRRQSSTASHRSHGFSKVGYVLTMAGIILFTSAVLFVLHFHREYTNITEATQTLDENRAERLEERSCEQPFCNTRECVSIAATMLQTMNPKADPCTDFYAYACGRYQRIHAVPYAMDIFSPTREARMNLLIDIRKTMDAPPSDNETSALLKMRTFYHSCTNASARNEQVNTTLTSWLHDLGVVGDDFLLGNPLDFEHSNMQWPQLVSKLEEHGIHTLFKPHFVENEHSAPETMEILCNIPFLQPEAYLNTTDDDLAYQLIMYKEALSQTLKNLNYGWEDRRAFVAEILKIETDIAKALVGSESVQDLSDENKQLLRDIWHPVVGEGMSEMGIESKCNVQSILSVLNHTSDKSVVKYVTWRMFLEMLQYMGHDFREVHIHYLTRLPGAQYAFDSKWKECADVLRSNFGLLTTHTLIDKGYLKRESLEALESDFSEVKRIFELAFGRLEETVKEKLLDKLNHIKLETGYTELEIEESTLDNNIYEDLEFNDNYFMNVIKMKQFKTRKHLTKLWYGHNGDANNKISLEDSPLGSTAHYDYETNTVHFDLGLLKFPLMMHSENIPSYLKYGYSTILAREVSRAFDFHGQHYDSEGKKTETPSGLWSGQIPRDYYRCLKNQTEEILKEKPHSVLEKSKLYLNVMADLASFGIPHKGLKDYVEDSSHEKPLPGIPLNKEQTFYLQSAQMLCELTSDVVPSPHSKYELPVKSRVNQIISNMNGFGELFNCASDSAMAPEHQCIFKL